METLSPEEVAEQLGVHPTFVRKQVRLGVWPHQRIGRRIRFTPKQVQLVLNMTERAAAPLTGGGLSRERLIAAGLTPQSAARQRANTIRPASTAGSSRSS